MNSLIIGAKPLKKARKIAPKVRGKYHAIDDRTHLPVCGGGRKGKWPKNWQVSIVEHNCKTCKRCLAAIEKRRLREEQRATGQLALTYA